MVLLQKTHIILYSSMTIFFYMKRQPLSLPQQSPPGGVMGLANWTVYGSGPVPLHPPGGGIIPFSTFVVSVRTCLGCRKIILVPYFKRRIWILGLLNFGV